MFVIVKVTGGLRKQQNMKTELVGNVSGLTF